MRGLAQAAELSLEVRPVLIGLLMGSLLLGTAVMHLALAFWQGVYLSEDVYKSKCNSGAAQSGSLKTCANACQQL